MRVIAVEFLAFFPLCFSTEIYGRFSQRQQQEKYIVFIFECQSAQSFFIACAIYDTPSYMAIYNTIIGQKVSIIERCLCSRFAFLSLQLCKFRLGFHFWSRSGATRHLAEPTSIKSA